MEIITEHGQYICEQFEIPKISRGERDSPKAILGRIQAALDAAAAARGLDETFDLSPLAGPAKELLELIAHKGNDGPFAVGGVIYLADQPEPAAAARLVRFALMCLDELGLYECVQTLSDLGPRIRAQIVGDLQAIVRIAGGRP